MVTLMNTCEKLDVVIMFGPQLRSRVHIFAQTETVGASLLSVSIPVCIEKIGTHLS